ncbi:rhodanese family protein [Sphingomonadaceae bacterium jetA1]|jgi:rhodanese-related sulfurtransferase|uniref:rhodanese family protein n=1 Tax=Facivitalis istanbulensis TaxID=3075838 RepID=UPI00348AAECF
MTLKAISPADARTAIAAGARLIDIRGTDEHARQHIPGAQNVPLDRMSDLKSDGRPVVFHCRTGMRTSANAAALAAAARGVPSYVLTGGIDAWRSAGHPVVANRSQPMEIMRQVQITTGSLVLIGVLLGLFVSPGFFALSGLVGAGLLLAGVSGWCGMAHLLRVMPWNRRVAA